MDSTTKSDGQDSPAKLLKWYQIKRQHCDWGTDFSGVTVMQTTFRMYLQKQQQLHKSKNSNF